MKTLFLLSAFCITLLCQTALATPYQSSNPKTTATQTLDRKTLEQQLGRKLTLKERIGLWWAKKKLQKAQKEPERKMSVSAIVGFGFSVVGVALLIPGFYNLSILVISLIAVFLGLLISIISLVNIAKAPEKKKGKIFAVFGLLVPLLMAAALFLISLGY